MYLVAYIIIFFDIYRVQKGSDTVRLCVSTVVKSFDFLVLPIVFFVVTTIFFPKHGSYRGYNQFNLSLFLPSLWQFFNNFIIPCFAIIAMIFLVSRIFIKISAEKSADLQEKDKYLLVFGFLILILGVLPYALVGKSPTSMFDLYAEGIYRSRHAILLPFGFSLICTYLLKTNVIFYGKKLTLSAKAFVFQLGFLCLLFWWLTYLHLAGLSALQQGIIQQLKETPAGKEYTFFWVNNNYPLGYLNPPFRSYAYAGMLTQAYGGYNRIGIDDMGADKNRQYFQTLKKQSSYLAAIGIGPLNVRGRWAKLTISQQHVSNPVVIGAEYLYYKYIDRKNFINFLNSWVNIIVQPYPTTER